MDDNVDVTWLVYLIVGALICGALVLFFKPKYRFEPIIDSNRNYYPAIKVNPPAHSDSSRDRERGRHR